MQSTPARTIFDVITDFLATEPSAQEIIDYRLPDELQERANYLAERNSEDLLSVAEREEMLEFMNADEMFSLLKTKMKSKLRADTE